MPWPMVIWPQRTWSFFFFFLFFFFFFLFVVNFVIHWNETSLSLDVFPIQIPPPTSLSTRSLQVLPEHQVRALVSCIQPGLVICFTLDSIHVSMLLSWNIPPSPSPTESLLFNMMPRFVIAFLPRSNHFLILWLQSLSTMILEPKKVKSVIVSTFSPSICYEVMVFFSLLGFILLE